MITGKINLLNLHAVKQMVKGKVGQVECLIIPIEKNKLFNGEKGVYLDIVAFEIKEPKEGSRDTHLVKQSFNKEAREKMSEEELKSLPILGNLSVSGVPQQETVSPTTTLSSDDDLPF